MDNIKFDGIDTKGLYKTYKFKLGNDIAVRIRNHTKCPKTHLHIFLSDKNEYYFNIEKSTVWEKEFESNFTCKVEEIANGFSPEDLFNKILSNNGNPNYPEEIHEIIGTKYGFSEKDESGFQGKLEWYVAHFFIGIANLIGKTSSLWMEDFYVWNNDYVLDYLNSNSIAKYLKKINYEFSTLEAAWVFINCNKKPLKDRHAALRELMEKLPDCDVEISQKGIFYPSLFDLLKKFITIEEQAIEVFFHPEEGRIYDVQVLKEPNSEWIGVSSPFTTLEALLKFCKNAFPSFEYLDISKAYINKPTLHPFVIYNSIGGLLSIQGYNSDEEDTKILRLFNYDIRINIPAPFERGDILISRYKKSDVSGNGDPFILDGFAFNTDSDNEINGIFYDTDGKSFSYGNLSVFNNDYMDLEYYKGPLKGALCLLSPISSLMAEKLDEVEALNEYLDNFKNNILIG